MMKSATYAVRSPYVVNIEDLRLLARRRLPRAVFDYLDGGAEGELTLSENVRVFREVTFRPRNAVATDAYNLKTRVLGEELSFPALLAPVGYSRLMHPGVRLPPPALPAMLERFISCPLFPAINWRMSKPRQRGLHGISSISSAAARPRSLPSTVPTKPVSQHWSLLLIRP